MNLITELKRRNVFRVAALYVVGSWLILQIGDLLFDLMGLPDWALRIVLGILLLGFPAAILLSWIYELTPGGIKRESEVDRSTSITPETGRRLDIAVIIVVVLGLVLVGIDRYLPRQNQAPSNQASVPPADVSNPSPTESSDGRASVAVLPFVNMSPDADNAYFADGISEELLNILSGIEGLKVASRTSAFSFKGTNTPIPEIARQLGVRHVLEGSVRKQGDQVRITAQLIEAGEDAHLWSERYDRDLDDIFQVQEEIAQAITRELESILGTRQVDVNVPTRNMDAYELYLRGRSRFYRRFELNEAVEDLRAAVEQDPEFAEAWAFLAALYWLHGNGAYQSNYDRGEMTRLAGVASRRASELGTEIPIALAVRGQIATDSGEPGAVAEGIRLLERAVAVPAPDTTPRLWLALLWLELGFAERAIPLLEGARQMDPLVGINAGALGVALGAEGHLVEAEKLALEAVERSGLTFWGDLLAVNRYHSQGSEHAAELLTAMIDQLDKQYEQEKQQALSVLQALDDPSAQDALLAEWVDYGDADIASLMFDHAARAFEAAPEDENRPWAIVAAAWMPAMEWLREDPRYFRLMDRRGRVEYWETHGYPRGCRPVAGPQGQHLDCPDAQ